MFGTQARDSASTKTISALAAAAVSALLFASPASADGYGYGYRYGCGGGCFDPLPFPPPPCAHPCRHGYAYPHHVITKPYYLVNQGPTFSTYRYLHHHESHGYYVPPTVYVPAYDPPRWIGYRPYPPPHIHYARKRGYPRHMHAPYAKTPLPPPRMHRKRGPVVNP